MKMTKQNFKITINANPEQVWKVLWDNDSYRRWAAEFSEGSYAATDWKAGSKALFLGPDETGMVSKIQANIPFKYMSIEHLGIVENDKEDTSSPEARKWAGAMENYTLTNPEVGKTVLSVDMDILDSFLDYFVETWPKALQKVKELAEKP
ncbi:SRPBCC domain-containing protein [Echinicola marina]|uniref:SRPBCC domain-containing protein n=1 Tax=Echinicola marina TaxID=2859768 RepID=UPI001CF699CB|nr:SRPBCC domain-containing protein [Echinicola marina]UCS91701.1 SRPBCC domain-containing protein [Echinicola marina]